MMGIQLARTADPALMLTWLRDKTSPRKLRLFACACCRLVWGLLAEQTGRKRVEAVERAIEGWTRVPARRAAHVPAPHRADSPTLYAEVASIFVSSSDPFAAALAASAMAERADADRAGRAAQAALVADIFGRPTRLLDSRWRTPEVVSLAQTIYHQRSFEMLPRLADLLEAAGCPPHNILDHLRSAGPHSRGCWALDMLLGKV
jgi:hypothetical protein